MARQTIEVVTCDVCGKTADDVVTVVIGRDGEQWELDLCPADHGEFTNQFDRLIEHARPAPRRRAVGSGSNGRGRSRKAPSDEWDYLESLGFKRHRGRKTAEETAALAERRT